MQPSCTEASSSLDLPGGTQRASEILTVIREAFWIGWI